MSDSAAPRQFPNTTKAWLYLKRKAASIKAQALREKFANEIKLIKTRNMTEPCIPVPSVLQEVWELVLQNLTNLSDITSAYYACEIFGDYLEKRRMTMLLPQVFTVLRDQRHLRYIKPDRDKSNTTKAVLNLRLVSKAWKEALEDQLLIPSGFVQSDWYLKRDRNSDSPAMVITTPFRCAFYETEDVERAMEVLRGPHSCLQLLRILYIYIAEDHDGDYERVRRSFFPKMMELLDAHGEHVWGLHVEGRFDYEHLRELVTRMPNLKELFLDYWKVWVARREINERGLIAQHPFPNIPSLKRIAFGATPQYRKLTAEMIRKNLNTVKTISISDASLGILLPPVERLCLECFDFRLGEDQRIDFPALQRLGKMQWPLKVLHISKVYGNFPVETVNAFDFIDILKRFNETLEDIRQDSMVLMDDGRKVDVDFPKLKNVGKVAFTFM